MTLATAGALMAAGLVCAAMPVSAARAEVFEIGSDGTMRTRNGNSDPGAAEWRAEAGPGLQDDQVDAGDAPQVPAAALTLVGDPEVPAAYQSSLQEAARRYDLSPSLLAALVWQESAWRPAALSSKGAIGLGQLMPATARALGVDPRDSTANLAGAAHYLRQLLDLFDGDVERALAAYNAGPARVLRANGVPAIAETRSYVSTIIDRLAASRPAASPGETR